MVQTTRNFELFDKKKKKKKNRVFIIFLTKSWHHFEDVSVADYYCLLLNYWFKYYHLSVFQKLRHSDTCNQVKSCTKYGRPDKSQRDFNVALMPYNSPRKPGRTKVQSALNIAWYIRGAFRIVKVDMFQLFHTSYWTFGVVYIKYQPLFLILPKRKKILLLRNSMKWQWCYRHWKISKKVGNLNRRKGTCMKCYHVEVVNANMHRFFSQ